MVYDWLLALAGSPWVYLALFSVATIDGFFPPVPSEPAVIALAALSMASGTPDLGLVLLVAMAGAFAGDLIAYAVGSRIDLRRIRILQNPRGQRAVSGAEHALARRGTSLILAARFVPVGRMAVNLTAGAIGYPRRRFVGLTALAAVTWSVYSIAIGLLAGAWVRDRPLVAIAVGVAGGILIGFALDWGLSRLRAIRDHIDAGVHGTPPDTADGSSVRTAPES
jgi:membrane protein DedA with SNARE-associated domain